MHSFAGFMFSLTNEQIGHLLWAFTILRQKNKFDGLPWRSSGWDSVLPLQGAQAPSLVGELRSRKPRGMAKKTKTNKKMSLNAWGAGFLSMLPGSESGQAVHLVSPPFLFEMNE